MKAMIRFGYENGYLWLHSGDRDLGAHSERVAECVERRGFQCRIGVGVDSPFDSLKENALFRVAMLVSVDDVPLAFEYPIGYLGDEASLIWAGQQCDQSWGLSTHVYARR